jgi:hypothetical protein
VPINLMKCWEAGVMDTQFPVAEGQDLRLERALGPIVTGIFTVLGAFQVDRVIEAFEAVTVEKVPTNDDRVVAIDTKFALSQPYRADKMRQATAIRRAGAEIEPVRVARLSDPQYAALTIVTNGAHRAYAARTFGDLTIPAIVHETWHIDPPSFCLLGRKLLLRPRANEDALSMGTVAQAADMPVDVCTMLAFLGTEIRAGFHRPSN